jgi:lipopolysaccharide transport system ATP-binding protein
MSDIAIRVDNLGKRYRIGARQKRARTFREALERLAVSPFGYLRGTLRGPSEEEILWALKQVSFEVRHGEVVGVIGRNGAGKSTLLKILSRITEPTTGRIEVFGRVGSLLEAGTGFNPELTGRENIYLNGAILGMRKAEIDRKFDEIVAFSEVEKFIDTPVKRYSSGMYVRLAFAVAAHLEPEILLVDEVLAVGDAAFQKKCLGKMSDVAKQGRTVLLVSHNMGSLRALCQKGIVFDAGHLIDNASMTDAVRLYLKLSQVDSAKNESAFVRLDQKRRRVATSIARLRWLRLCDAGHNPKTVFSFGEGMRIVIGFQVEHPVRVGFHVVVKSTVGDPLILFSSTFHRASVSAEGGGNEVELVIPHLPLASGRYALDVVVYVPYIQNLDYVEDACFFGVDNSYPGGGGMAYEQRLGMGYLYVEHSWKLPEVVKVND